MPQGGKQVRYKMKASESIEKFAPSLRMYANFAKRTITDICKNIGPREAGTQAELDAQNYLAEKVGDAADEVRQEEFEISHRAFLGWPRISGIIMLIATAITAVDYYVFKDVEFSPWIMLVAALLVLFMLVGEFLMYRKVTDAFFPKWTSHNTYCIRKPKGEVKKRIIMAGHSDSSMEWLPTHLGGKFLLYFWLGYPVVGLFITLILTVINIVHDGDLRWTMILSFIIAPAFVLIMFFMNNRICVDGANDNLTGCMMGAAVIKFMGDNDIRFENTEVIAMFSGSEEEGLRGAKAAAKLHPEWKDPNVETVFIAYDTITDYDDMGIYYRDMTMTVRQDERACCLMEKGCENADIKVSRELLFFGASDAAACGQAGIPSICFAAMNPGPPKYYHTRDDKADILNLKTLEKGIQIALETTFAFDEQGLKTNYD